MAFYFRADRDSVMKYIVSLCLIVLLQATAMPSFANSILQLGVEVRGGNVEIRAIGHPSVPAHRPPVGSIDRLQSIYFSLECFVNRDCGMLRGPQEAAPRDVDPDDLVPMLKDEGERVLGPFADLIRTSDEVRFRVDWSLLKLPLDLLYLHDRPLFLSKRISFTVGHPRNETLKTPSRNWIGLLVSDESADPDRAIFSLQRVFSRSQLFDIAQFDLSKLQEIEPVDFVAISGHGFVEGSGNDHISIGDTEKLLPGSLAKLRPKLVYFDSCNLGVSTEHLKKLQSGGTVYAVAPILSNEAGNSSTATIELFFSELAKGADPVAAMSVARSKLYDQYATDDIRTKLWRAFPFRVYILN